MRSLAQVPQKWLQPKRPMALRSARIPRRQLPLCHLAHPGRLREIRNILPIRPRLRCGWLDRDQRPLTAPDRPPSAQSAARPAVSVIWGARLEPGAPKAISGDRPTFPGYIRCGSRTRAYQRGSTVKPRERRDDLGSRALILPISRMRSKSCRNRYVGRVPPRASYLCRNTGAIIHVPTSLENPRTPGGGAWGVEGRVGGSRHARGFGRTMGPKVVRGWSPRAGRGWSRHGRLRAPD